MSDLFLTEEEKRRFVAWLHRQAIDGEQLAKQIELLPGMDMLAKHRRAEAAAFAFVARYIDSTETVSIDSR